MLYIPKFAREIGLDSISFQKLRIEKFSPLKEVVEATPGYYYRRIGGHVFSDQFGPRELKRIRNRIRGQFYTPAQLLRIARKARRIGLVDARDVAGMSLRLPLLAYSLIRRHIRKSARGRNISPRASDRLVRTESE